MHAQDGACGRKGFEWHVMPGLGMSKSRCMPKTEHVGGKV